MTMTNTANTENDIQDETSPTEVVLEPVPDYVSTIHIIVLVHGWLGNPLEMDSIKESLIRYTSSFKDTDSHFLVHAATCNEGRTHDGIAAGGSRLAQEVNQIIKQLQEPPSSPPTLLKEATTDDDDDDEEAALSSPKKKSKKTKLSKITLSFVGNSLGGLYSRYALGEIDFAANNMEIVPKLFITTATPHLGVNQNTYLKLPRAVERPIATVMQQTGLDLFCFTPTLHQMTMESKFVTPLLKFEHRIAYANVYGTDFQVPTATAAFWEEDSDSEHFKVEHSSQNGVDIEARATSKSLQFLQKVNQSTSNSNNKENAPPSPWENDNVVAVYETPSNPKVFDDDYTNFYENQHQNNNDNTPKSERPLSKYLDAMGWTKVLIDVRQHLPSWRTSNSNIADDDTNNKKDDPLSEEMLPLKNNAKTATSSMFASSSAQELLQEYGGGKFLTVPLGHTVMVNNSKDKLNRWITQGGKPIMDSLAGSMVNYISTQDNAAPQWPKGL